MGDIKLQLDRHCGPSGGDECPGEVDLVEEGAVLGGVGGKAL